MTINTLRTKIGNHIVTICFLSLYLVTPAQETGKQNVIVYEPFGTSKRDSVASPQPNNCIKWNWSLAPRGVLMFACERKVNNFATLEPGLGLTHADYLYELTTSNNFIYEEGTSVKPGFAGELSVKIYPGRMEDFKGFFASFGARYRLYRLWDKYDEDVGYSFLERFFLVGYQHETSWNNVLEEFYIGVSLKRTQSTSRKENDIFISETFEYKSRDFTYPYFMCGYKIGFSL